MVTSELKADPVNGTLFEMYKAPDLKGSCKMDDMMLAQKSSKVRRAHEY